MFVWAKWYIINIFKCNTRSLILFGFLSYYKILLRHCTIYSDRLPLTKTKSMMPNRKQIYERMNCGSISCNTRKAKVLHTYFLTRWALQQIFALFHINLCQQSTTQALIHCPILLTEWEASKKKNKTKQPINVIYKHRYIMNMQPYTVGVHFTNDLVPDLLNSF